MSIQQESPPESTDGIDAALSGLAAGEAVWAGTPVAGRRRLLERMHTLVGQNAQAWVDAARTVKKLTPGTPLVGEEWMSGPYATLQSLAVLIESLKAIERGGSPVDGYSIGEAPGGRVPVHGLPHRSSGAAARRRRAAGPSTGPGWTRRSPASSAGSRRSSSSRAGGRRPT